MRDNVVENKYFRDLTCNVNLHDGVEFHAVGIITQDLTETSLTSGKDYAVMYIDPWGIVQRAYRKKSEIIIEDLDSDLFCYLCDRIFEME